MPFTIILIRFNTRDTLAAIGLYSPLDNMAMDPATKPSVSAVVLSTSLLLAGNACFTFFGINYENSSLLVHLQLF